MKPIIVTGGTSSGKTITVNDGELPYFLNPWHYHPELELSLIQKGYGQRLVGDSVENFSPGSLVLLGANLTHAFKCDDVFFKKDSKLKVKAIQILFLPQFASEGFLDLPAMNHLKKLIYEHARQGVKLVGALRDTVEKMMIKYVSCDQTDQIYQLIQILDTISKSKETESLASINYRNVKAQKSHRLNAAFDYIMTNYNEEITLDKVADHVNMNKNAFCRFFKKGTKKSLFTVVNEVRIAKACHSLTTSSLDVLQICYLSGYNSISNFNRSFRKVTGTSPLEYKKTRRKF